MSMAGGAPTVVASQSTTNQQPDTSSAAVVARAAEYLKSYQQALQFLLADETTVQDVFNADDEVVAHREMSGEFFLSYVEADRAWLAVRDTKVVDGVPVRDGGDLRALLDRGVGARIGREIADRNARYNIGPIERNFNDPMLALTILDDRHRDRFKFSRRRVTRTPDETVVTVEFEERDRPTLVRGSDGSPIFSRGAMEIDAATGRLRQTTIELQLDSTTASLITTFSAHDALGLWLPATLTERYEHTGGRIRQRVVAESSYTRYRKFDVNVIIKTLR